MTASTNGDDRAPAVTADGKTMYFTRNAIPNAGYDIYVATRSSAGVAFDAPQPAAFPLNDSANDFVAWVSPPEASGNHRILQAFVASARAGSVGGQDIWYASRVDASQGFSNPVRVAELSTPTDDLPMWVTPDGCTLYFSSVRSTGPGSLDVFVATRGK